MGKIKIFLLTLLFFGVVNVVNAYSGDNEFNGKIKGKVIDKLSNHPIEYATITIYTTTDNSLVTGTITDLDGNFEVKNLPKNIYKVEITFLGYAKITKPEVPVGKTGTTDIGSVYLQPDGQILEEVVVVANQSSVEYQIDKKVIAVSEQMTSASMSAVEVLENIPSIQVDFEGNVMLRGSSGFTVLIDGKPTVLDPSDVLRQMPASSILNIEIITNPSSRYQPDGTGGIINIVTKKNRMQGLNGLANANAGMFNNYGADLLLNYRKDNVNFYVSGDFRNRSFPGESFTERRTIQDGQTTIITSEGQSQRGGQGKGLRAGLDWDITEKDLFSLGVRFGEHAHGGTSELTYITSYEPANGIIEEFSSNESVRGGQFLSLTNNMVHKFEKKGHELALQVNYRYRNGDEFSENLLSDVVNGITSGARTTEKGPSSRWDIRLDYNHPLSKKAGFETGLQFRKSYSVDDTELFWYETTVKDFVIQEDKSNTTNYDRKIMALYGIFKGEINRLGYQAGLRTEYTFRDIESVNLGQNFTIDRWDIFPTAHLSYKLPDDNQVMASYSRRIDRPRGWNLEPFITWSDLFNVRQGNPGLLPEYIDAMEMAYLKTWKKSSFSLETYYRIRHNKIERILEVYDEETFLMTFDNVGKDYSLGLEGMFNLTPFKWWEVNLMGNLFDYRIEGELDEQSFSNRSFNWNTRLNNTFKLSKNLRFQLSFNYNSPSVSAQGENLGYYVFNSALRSDFLDKRLSVVLQVRDIFRSRERVSITESSNFYNYRSRRSFAPMVSASVSYRINNYRNKKGRNGRGNGDGGGEEEGEF
jgi:outer membrane cobalamin receptor